MAMGINERTKVRATAPVERLWPAARAIQRAKRTYTSTNTSDDTTRPVEAAPGRRGHEPVERHRREQQEDEDHHRIVDVARLVQPGAERTQDQPALWHPDLGRREGGERPECDGKRVAGSQPHGPPEYTHPPPPHRRARHRQHP